MPAAASATDPSDRPVAAPAGAGRAPASLDRDRLAALLTRELDAFVAARPRSRKVAERARRSLVGGVPMSWMTKGAGPFPVVLASARGAHLTDVDGIDYVDLCLGDTGAMTGHSPAATVAAVTEQLSRGITTMLPTEDAVAVAEDLARRFGLPRWQVTLSATDANRHVIRYARHLTGRSKIVVFDYCYHGTVDETFATLDAEGRTVARRGNIGAPVPLEETTRVVPWNDVAALEAALAHGDVAAVLTEPALTNVGIVLPAEGFHAALRELTRAHGAYLVIDETHTISVGPGGMTARDGLEPDLLVMGKPIGGGIPCGVFGMTEEIARAIEASVEREDVDVGGIGGTLAGNALSLAAMRATLTEVLTEEAFATMLPLGERWADGVDAAMSAHGAAWQCSRLGARGEYTFSPVPPHDGASAAAASDPELERFLHLYLLNRGVLMTPFHNMALMSPATTGADVDRHTVAFEAALGELFG